MSVILRGIKGSPLSQAELDNNQVELGSKLGHWSSTITYSENQMVSFLGNVYKSVANSNTNNLPNLTAQWELYKPPHVHGFADISGATSTDILLSANSNTLIPTQRAVKTYVDSAISGIGYTNEQAQDATAAALASGTAAGDLSWVYDDGAASLAGTVKNLAITGAKVADNTLQLTKIATQAGPVIIGRGAGTGSLTALTLSSNLAISGATLGLAPITGQTILGAETTGAPAALSLGSFLSISGSSLRTNMSSAKLLGRVSGGSGQAEEIGLGAGLSFSGGNLVSSAAGYSFTTNNRLYGRSTAGAGEGEEITLGSGLSFSGTTLNATGTGYTFTNTTRLYGRSTAGGGPGEEITIGAGLSLASGALTATGAGLSFTASNRLLGRVSSGAGAGEELTIGTGFSISGTTINAGVYEFTDTTRLYGRSTAGAGAGEEISIGSGLSLVAGVLSASGGGGGGSQPGILGYETAPTGLYRAVIASESTIDPNQSLGTMEYVAFIANGSTIPDSLDNHATNALVAASNMSSGFSGSNLAIIASSDINIQSSYETTISGSSISTITESYQSGIYSSYASFVTGANHSAVIAAQNGSIWNLSSGIYGITPYCALVHGANVAGASSARTFNYGMALPDALISSFDVDSSYQSGPDGSAVIETTLIAVNNGFSGSSEFSNISTGRLADILRAGSTTVAPFYFYLYIDVLAVSASGDKAAIWEIRALVKGVNVEEFAIVAQNRTLTFTTTPAFGVGVQPTLALTSSGNEYITLRATGESGSSTTFYAYVRAQKLIRTVA